MPWAEKKRSGNDSGGAGFLDDGGPSSNFGSISTHVGLISIRFAGQQCLAQSVLIMELGFRLGARGEKSRRDFELALNLAQEQPELFDGQQMSYEFRGFSKGQSAIVSSPGKEAGLFY